MSYCRFSSDDFRCDIYAYESAEGFIVHVASVRYLGDIPKLQPTPEQGDDSGWKAWHKAHSAQSEFLLTAKTEPIGLLSDGEVFVFPTEDEMFAGCLVLKEAGYSIPEYMLGVKTSG